MEKNGITELCQALQLERRMLSTSEASRRTFIAFQKKLHPLPDGFMMFAPTRLMPIAGSHLFTFKGKLRIALDLCLPANRQEGDESLSQFVLRRLGKEALDRIAEPLIGGIYGAPPEHLSARATVSKLVMLEQKYGSLIRGLLLEKNKSQNAPRFTSFDNGMMVLVNKLTAALPKESILCNTSAQKILSGAQGRKWDVILENGFRIAADAVILALPSVAAAPLLSHLSPSLSGSLSEIHYGQSVMISIAYNRKQIRHALDGSGFVVPRSEQSLSRACTFSSTKFARRAPRNKVLLRVFVPGQCAQSDTDLIDQVTRDMNSYLGIQGSPLLSRVTRHTGALPQYEVGHAERVMAIDRALSELPGLALAGNAYRGVGVPDCVESGKRAAKLVLSHMSQGTYIT